MSHNFYFGKKPMTLSLAGINPIEILRTVVSQIHYKPDESQLMQPSLVKALATNLKKNLLPQTQEFEAVLPPIGNASLVDRDDEYYCFNQRPAIALAITADKVHSFFEQLPIAVLDIPRVAAMYDEGVEWQAYITNTTYYERNRMQATIDRARDTRNICNQQKIQLDLLSTALTEGDRLNVEAVELRTDASIVSDLAVAVVELPSTLRSFFTKVQPTFEAGASLADVEEVASFAAFANLTNATSIAMKNAPGEAVLTNAEQRIEHLLSSTGCLAVEIAAADARASKAAAADTAFYDGTYPEEEEGVERAEYEQLRLCLQNISATLDGSVVPAVSAFDGVRTLLLELRDGAEEFASTELVAFEELDTVLRATDARVGQMLSTASSDSRSNSSSRRTVGSIAAALVRQDPVTSPGAGLYAEFGGVFTQLAASAGVSAGLGAQLAAVARALQQVVDNDIGAGNSTSGGKLYTMSQAQAKGEEYRERVKQLPGPLVALYQHMRLMMPEMRWGTVSTYGVTVDHDKNGKNAFKLASRLESLLLTLSGATNDIANYTNNIQITLQTFVAEDADESFSEKSRHFQNEANHLITHLSAVSSKIDAISAELVMLVEGNRDMAAFSDVILQQQFVLEALDSSRTGEKGLGDIYDADSRILDIRAALKPLLEVTAQVKPELTKLTSATAILASAARVAAKGMESGGDGEAGTSDSETLETKLAKYNSLAVKHGEATRQLLRGFLAPANELYRYPQSPAFAVEADETTGVDVWAGALGSSSSRSSALLSIVDVRQAATMGVFRAAEDLSPSGPNPIGPLLQNAQREVATLLHENLAPLTLGIATDSILGSPDADADTDADEAQALSCMHTSRSFCPPKLGSQHLQYLRRRLTILQSAVSSAALVCRFNERGPMGLNAPSGGSSASPAEVVRRLSLFAAGAANFTKDQALTLLDANVLAERALAPLASDTDGGSNAFGYLRKTIDCSAQAAAIVTKTQTHVAKSMTLLSSVEAQQSMLNSQLGVVDSQLGSIETGDNRDTVSDIVYEMYRMARGWGSQLTEFEILQRDVHMSKLEQSAAQVSVTAVPKMKRDGQWTTGLEDEYLDVVGYSEAIHETLFPSGRTVIYRPDGSYGYQLGVDKGIGVDKKFAGRDQWGVRFENGTSLDPDHDWGTGLRGLNMSSWAGGYEKKISDFRLTLGVQFGQYSKLCIVDLCLT
jgi:hypothetical protein